MSAWPPPPDDPSRPPLPPSAPPPWPPPPPPPGAPWPAPPGYGPAYGAPPRSSGTNQLGLTSMILGISAAVSTFCCALVSVPLALGAVGTGIVALAQHGSNPHQQGRGQAIAGIACGGVAIVLQIAFLILQFGSFAFYGTQS